ncbi:Cytochrome c heme lyase subunit CcmL [hydrothermal vent metagenome]|uniref:Cytochrome c heme lyase subunit CcmL n=1 Tax=hydrothermal vent metagenome TaxID=652676 RepID=A0A3B0XWM7_9ZZZZ
MSIINVLSISSLSASARLTPVRLTPALAIPVQGSGKALSATGVSAVLFRENIIAIIFVFVMLMFSTAANARFEAHTFPSAQAEKDYAILVQELRCLVCQNQNLADSNAELAQDMRLRVYKMLLKGKTRDEIVTFMVSRYGDFVMYRPPVKSSTYLLWYGPLVFFALAGIVVAAFLRRQKSADTEVKIDEEQQKKAHSLLDGK